VQSASHSMSYNKVSRELAAGFYMVEGSYHDLQCGVSHRIENSALQRIVHDDSIELWTKQLDLQSAAIEIETVLSGPGSARPRWARSSVEAE
jgi:hypothetical protein